MSFSARYVASVGFVARGNAEQHQQPSLDLADDVAGDRDRSAAHALNTGTHARIPFRRLASVIVIGDQGRPNNVLVDRRGGLRY